jgi:diguanylate cyclase (GGDEF)-like protein
LQKILVVEDSKAVSKILKIKIESILQFNAVLAETFDEAKQIVDNKKNIFFLCLADLHLPDAQSGEIVDYLISKDIPTIVFTEEVSETIRKKILSKNVIDYVMKEGGHNIDYILKLISRIYKNKWIKILVVDDSQLFRLRITGLLNVYQYIVFQANNGIEALKVLKDNPDIKLVITDYNMPEMNGLQLVREIRDKYDNEQIGIIGISGDSLLSAKFIKLGANDFLSKDFFAEEFYCRVNQNIELLERIAEIKEASNKDYLTGIYNRRFFYEVGEKLFENSKRKNLTLTLAMLDIDFFKKINDKYGHNAGDRVLKKIASVLLDRFRASDIVSRFGGEEFCVLAVNMEKKSVENIFDSVRKKIEEIEFSSEKGIIKTTISIGICNELMSDLDEMIKQADLSLYQAKENGRNKVIITKYP